MAKRQKLLEQLQRSPKNVSIREIKSLLEAYGFILKRTKGSHHIFIGMLAGRQFAITVPFNRPIKPIYVKQVVELCQQKEAEEGEEENGDEQDDCVLFGTALFD